MYTPEKIKDPQKIEKYQVLPEEVKKLLPAYGINSADTELIDAHGAMDLRILLYWQQAFDYATTKALEQEQVFNSFVDRAGFKTFTGDLADIPGFDEGVTATVPNRGANTYPIWWLKDIGFTLYGFAPNQDADGWQFLASIGQVVSGGTEPIVIKQSSGHDFPEVFLTGNVQRVFDPLRQINASDNLATANRLAATQIGLSTGIDSRYAGLPVLSVSLPKLGQYGDDKHIEFILTQRAADMLSRKDID